MGKKNYINRSAQEQAEGLPTSEVNAPEGRIQSKQQIADTMSAASTTPSAATGLAIQEHAVPSQVVHTTKAAELVKSTKGLTSGGSANGGVATMQVGSYGGSDGTVIGDMSASTQLDKSDRSPTRTGKKLDSTLKKINYLYNEQVSVKYDESKPLAENPSATQGYNGTYRNEHARTQKKTGFVPAELYYDRSVDEIHQDFVYPVMGQSINDPAPKAIPSYELNDEGVREYTDFECNRGNHMHTALYVTFDDLGKVKGFEFGDLDATPDTQDFDVANVSAVNAIIDANTAELDRQNMDANAGDELSPKFSPLARSIAAPTATIGLLRDIEASTGSEVFMAYKKTTMAMSYQLNKAAKDGQRITSPIPEMLLGCMSDDVKDTTILKSCIEGEYYDAFSAANCAAGSAATMIKVYDSIGKYNTKGDYLLQPRGFRMHIQTADNAMNVLRVPKKFVDSVNTNEVFSTIDREYDPFLPVCISDKASLAHPYSFNAFIKDNAPRAFSYKYTNNTNNTYIVDVYHPLVKGLYDYFSSLGSKFYSCLSGSGDRTIKIPCMHATTGFSLWSLVLLAATPFIVKARLSSFIDVFDYEENFGYPFSQLISMKEANPMFSKNYICSDYNEPITVKQMIPAVAFKWVFPETYWLNKETALGNEIVLPWYHNEQQYEINSDGVMVIKSGDSAVMSLPSIRSGSRFGFFDTIYGMEERDVRLCLDRQTVYPAYKKNKNDKIKTYKYGLSTDGQPVVLYADADFTYEALIKTPREMGWVIPAPNGMLTQLFTEYTTDANYETGRKGFDTQIADVAPGFFRIRYWQGETTIDAQDVVGILDKASVNVNRAMSLRQGFKCIINQRMVGSYRDWTSQDFIVSFASLFDANATNPAVVNNRAMFKPFTIDGAPSTDSDDKQVSMQKYFWTRVQRLPFAINPFDCSPQAKASGKDSVHTDPYDFTYIFGCAGFRASDYNEDSYNREKERLNLGMLFIEDPYFNESPLYRG